MKKPLELEGVFAGSHISDVAGKALKMAEDSSRSVHFEFNGTGVIVEPGESRDAVVARWDKDREAAAKAYRESPEYAQRQKEREDKDRQARAATMKETAANESEMREATVPWPLTKEQLAEYVESLIDRQHDYGTCVYAASMAAVAAFHHVAGRLGMTGFQAGCADLDVIRRTRNIKGPFMLLKAEDALYPQYDLPSRLDKALEEWQPWLKEEAAKKLAETHEAHPDVVAHWERLAEAK